MADEDVFRIAMIAGFAAMTCIGLYYRLRSRTDEKLDRRQEGVVVLLGLRLIALVWFAGIIVYMINPEWMAWSAVEAPVWLRWTGLLIAVLSMALKTWTFHTLGKNLTDTVVTRQEHSLVTTGPYYWVRHPFYTSFAADVLGVSLLAANWFLLLGGSMVFAFILVRTRTEEAKLIERFGEEYRCYMKRVGPFLPRPPRRPR